IGETGQRKLILLMDFDDNPECSDCGILRSLGVGLNRVAPMKEICHGWPPLISSSAESAVPLWDSAAGQLRTSVQQRLRFDRACTMGLCSGCHAGCCRSFAVPVSGADVLRIETRL